MRTATSLEIIKDSEGAVAFGWVSERVVYARIEGGLSATVGMELAARLQASVERVDSIAYFADASEMTHYDLLARSGFVRVVLANRRKFAQLVTLTWSQGSTRVTRSLESVLGAPADFLTDSAEFHGRLLRAAPEARKKLDPRTWVHVAPPLPPER